MAKALSALVCIVCVASPAAAQTKMIGITDANWYFSPYNWRLQGADFASTRYPGAYFKIGFTGTNVAIAVEVTPLKPIQSSLLPVIRWRIDSLPTQDHQLQHNDTIIALNSKALPSGAHSLIVWYVSSDFLLDGWTEPIANILRISGLIVDQGASTLPPVLSPTRMVFFGDSLTLGSRTESASGNIVDDSDATHSFTFNCAAGLSAEFGVVGVSGQGWTIPGLDGVTPPLPAAWTWQIQNVPRLFTPEPDHLVVMEGANDYLRNNVDPGVIASTIPVWLAQVRAMLPNINIFLVVEFNGFYQDAVTTAFHTYQLNNPWDKHAYLINLGAAGQEGLLTHFSAKGSLYSYDGIHPTAARQAVLGQAVAQAIQAALSK